MVVGHPIVSPGNSLIMERWRLGVFSCSGPYFWGGARLICRAVTSRCVSCVPARLAAGCRGLPLPRSLTIDRLSLSLCVLIGIVNCRCADETKRHIESQSLSVLLCTLPPCGKMWGDMGRDTVWGGMAYGDFRQPITNDKEESADRRPLLASSSASDTDGPPPQKRNRPA